MKKLKNSRLLQVILLVTIVAGVYFSYQTYRKHELTQFVIWSPRKTISKYEFMDDKAVAIQWDNESEKKEAKEAEKYDSRIKVGEKLLLNNERYLIQQSYKLRKAPYKYWLLDEDAVPYLDRNYPLNGEYWFLDVYDTKEGVIKQKTYDVFKMVRDYNKNYIPIKISDSNSLFQTEEGKSYLPIRMLVSRKPKFEARYGLIEIESGKIIDKTPNGKTAKEFYNASEAIWKLQNRFEDIIDYDDRLSKLNLNFFWSTRLSFKKEVKKDQDYSLSIEHPEIFNLLQNVSSSKLYFIGPEDVQFKISLLKQVLPKGTNIFKDVTIPAESSVDGQEHVVQSEEEFLKYYKTDTEEVD